jgi:hypothetical protein
VDLSGDFCRLGWNPAGCCWRRRGHSRSGAIEPTRSRVANAIVLVGDNGLLRGVSLVAMRMGDDGLFSGREVDVLVVGLLKSPGICRTCRFSVARSNFLPNFLPNFPLHSKNARCACIAMPVNREEGLPTTFPCQFQTRGERGGIVEVHLC